jgi:hypothetical protein
MKSLNSTANSTSRICETGTLISTSLTSQLSIRRASSPLRFSQYCPMICYVIVDNLQGLMSLNILGGYPLLSFRLAGLAVVRRR